MPTVTPVTYTAAGATLVASGAVMVSSLVRETLGRWRHVRIDNHAV
jgi:hypothetical protein